MVVGGDTADVFMEHVQQINPPAELTTPAAGDCGGIGGMTMREEKGEKTQKRAQDKHRRPETKRRKFSSLQSTFLRPPAGVCLSEPRSDTRIGAPSVRCSRRQMAFNVEEIL